jgi:nitrogen regulatory protein P-II 1
MRKIETTFPSDYRDDVMRAVLRLRARCKMVATEVCFADASTIHKVQYRGVTYDSPWLQQTRLEILIGDRDVDAVLEILVKALEVEREVETIITVSNVEDAIHLPTGRRGELAIQTLLRRSFAKEPRVSLGRR